MRSRCVILAIVGCLLVVRPAAASQIVISQVYGGGGNTGATYTNDFVEIFNRGSVAVDLTGWSLQYASATGTGDFGVNSAQLTLLSGFIQPGQYFLVQEAQGAGGTTALPTPDITDVSPISMSATAGKVALVLGTASLGCNGGSTPCSGGQLALIQDLVGYGTGPTTGANFFEGTGAAPTLSNTTAAFRASGGCTDTDDNAADFSSGAPAPRNSASPLHPCAAAVPEPATLALIASGLLALGAAQRLGRT
ncbi:MAG TPA: lamin tail domain-containing protein [Vicinamibacterales bacterium]|nr:lamin tail domain-containing protein [Vicinamibacterales bacterium]